MSKQQEYRLPWIFTEGIYSIRGGCLFCLASAAVGSLLLLVCFTDTYWIDSFWAFFYTALFTMPVTVMALWGIPLLLIQIGLLFYKLFDEIPIFHVFFGFCITQYLAGIGMTIQVDDFRWRYDLGRSVLVAGILFILVAFYILTYFLYRKALKKLPKFRYATQRARHKDESLPYYDPSDEESDGESAPSNPSDQQSERDRVSQLKIPY